MKQEDMTRERVSRRFDEELNSLRARLMDMGSLVESQIAKTIELLKTGNVDIAEQILTDEKTVNKKEVELDTVITQLVARWQPAAVDLRFLMSANKVLMDLERIGDEAKKIANNSRDIFERDGRFLQLANLEEMGTLVISMFHRAVEAFCTIDAFCLNDATVAVEISYEDHQVDDALKAIYNRMIDEMTQNAECVRPAMEVLSIAKSFERIGDHAKNIAEYVVYLAYGRHVRHYSAQKIERKLEKYSS